jgi:uncharacterized protein (TIGR00725 family)
MRRTVVGVMGGCSAAPEALENAYELGRLVADRGWVLLNGGRPEGIMEASAKGAREAGGLTVGVLFGDDKKDACEYLDIVIPTGMGAGRNIINVMSGDVVVACPGSGGTLSEIAMGLRIGQRVILLDFDPGSDFLDKCGEGQWSHAANAAEAVAQIEEFLDAKGT